MIGAGSGELATFNDGGSYSMLLGCQFSRQREGRSETCRLPSSPPSIPSDGTLATAKGFVLPDDTRPCRGYAGSVTGGLRRAADKNIPTLSRLFLIPAAQGRRVDSGPGEGIIEYLSSPESRNRLSAC